MECMVLYMSLDPSDYEAHQLDEFVPYLVKINHRLSKQGKLPCRSTTRNLDWVSKYHVPAETLDRQYAGEER